jgi:hypothetical protein
MKAWGGPACVDSPEVVPRRYNITNTPICQVDSCRSAPRQTHSFSNAFSLTAVTYRRPSRPASFQIGRRVTPLLASLISQPRLSSSSFNRLTRVTLPQCWRRQPFENRSSTDPPGPRLIYPGQESWSWSVFRAINPFRRSANLDRFCWTCWRRLSSGATGRSGRVAKEADETKLATSATECTEIDARLLAAMKQEEALQWNKA